MSLCRCGSPISSTWGVYMYPSMSTIASSEFPDRSYEGVRAFSRRSRWADSGTRKCRPSGLKRHPAGLQLCARSQEGLGLGVGGRGCAALWVVCLCMCLGMFARFVLLQFCSSRVSTHRLVVIKDSHAVVPRYVVRIKVHCWRHRETTPRG